MAYFYGIVNKRIGVIDFIRQVMRLVEQCPGKAGEIYGTKKSARNRAAMCLVNHCFRERGTCEKETRYSAENPEILFKTAG